MLPPFPGTDLSFADQLDLLKSRGLAVTDEPLALRHLERIGYYRLKSYWFPFCETRTSTGSDGKPVTQALETFRAGTEFQHAVQLYVFDKKLRLLMSDAIERIEVALRVDIAHTLGHRDPWAHRNPGKLDPKRAVQIRNGVTRHHEWLTRADEAADRTRIDWIVEAIKGHSTPLPIWIAVETWDFGILSHLFEIAHPADRVRISRKYGIPDPEMLVSWMRTLTYVRNICAHHSRLWNHPLVLQPKIPALGLIPELNQLSLYTPCANRVYASAAIAQHLISVINPASSWKERLKALWGAFPKAPGITPALATGFMPSWTSWALWQ
jgi:abortive infection bacteriophage resistance protein